MKNKNTLGLVQWILCVLSIFMAIGAFSNGGKGLIGGIIILLSAFIISPLFSKTVLTKKDIKKAFMIQCALAFVMFIVGIAITSPKRDKKEESSSSTIVSSKSEEVKQSDTTKETVPTETTTTTTTSATTTTTSATTTTTTTTKVDDKDVIGVSDKILSKDDIEIDFAGEMQNDVTGRWRLSRVASSFDIKEYAVDYYNNYFKNNKEVHIIVNYSLKTTTTIIYQVGLLYVTVCDYVDKEEFDAHIAGSGTVLEECYITLDDHLIHKYE